MRISGIFRVVLVAMLFCIATPHIGSAAEMLLFSKSYSKEKGRVLVLPDRVAVPPFVETLRFVLRSSDPRQKDVKITFNGEKLRLSPGSTLEIANPQAAAYKEFLQETEAAKNNAAGKFPATPPNELTVELQGKEGISVHLTIIGIFDPAKAPRISTFQ